MTLIEKLADKDLLAKCWKQIYQNKSEEIAKFSRGIDDISLSDFEKNKEKNLNELHAEIIRGEFKIMPIKPIFQVKAPDKTRLLSVPTVRDRIIHKAVLSILNPYIYPYINTGVSYCGVKEDYWGKAEEALGIKMAVEQIISHVKAGHFFVFETDIQGFFDNVPKRKMLEKIYQLLPDNSLNEIINDIVNFVNGDPESVTKRGMKFSDDTGISQGSSLSPIFANLYLADFDVAMKKIYGKRFIRYVDDFIIMCKTKEETVEARIQTEKNLRIEDLDLAPHKTFEKDIFHQDQLIFLGLSITRTRITHKKNIKEIKTWFNDKVLNKTKYKVKTKNSKKEEIVDQMNEKILGWGRYYRFYHVSKLFSDLDELLKKRQKQLPTLKLLNTIELDPIISEEKWRKLFLNPSTSSDPTTP